MADPIIARALSVVEESLRLQEQRLLLKEQVNATLDALRRAAYESVSSR
jgi:hypothetical protein